LALPPVTCQQLDNEKILEQSRMKCLISRVRVIGSESDGRIEPA
jgi:hypothetical protein